MKGKLMFLSKCAVCDRKRSLFVKMFVKNWFISNIPLLGKKKCFYKNQLLQKM